MGRQLPKKSPEKAIWAWAGLAGAWGWDWWAPKQNRAAEAAAELPWQVPLGKVCDSLACGSPRWSKVNWNETIKGRGTVGKGNILYFLCWKDQTPLQWFWRMFCLRTWLFPSPFKSPVWYTVVPISTNPVLPSSHSHTFLLGSCFLAQWWTNSAKTPSVLLCQENQPSLQPRH